MNELQYYCTTENLLHRHKLHNVKFHTLRRTIPGLRKVLRADGAGFRWSVIPWVKITDSFNESFKVCEQYQHIRNIYWTRTMQGMTLHEKHTPSAWSYI